MTQNALTVLQYLMAWGWRFMTGYYIPGTNVTPGACLLFIFFVTFVIKFARRLFNVNQSSSSKED